MMDTQNDPAAGLDADTPPRTVAPGRYAARQSSQDASQVLGMLDLRADGTLAVIDADAAAPGPLDKIAASMNSADVLHVDVAPPPGAPRFAMASRIVRRGEPDFIPALLDQLARYYRLELTPA